MSFYEFYSLKKCYYNALITYGKKFFRIIAIVYI